VREDLLDIHAGIAAGRYVNEATVSQGIVQRLLHSLGWPVYDTEVVAPEYSLGGRRADYALRHPPRALCHPPREPVILVEVKQIGQSKGADRQLFEYAFHKGVPMAVLTDGQEWHFFLPTEQGDYGERRVYKLDLLERDPQEAEAGLERYLGYEEVRSGRAIEAARRDYRNAARKRTAQRTLPDAWIKLVESEDDILVELLSDKVEDLCGVKPDPDAVAAFLREQASLKVGPLPWQRPREQSEPLNRLQAAAVFQGPSATRSKVIGTRRGAPAR
jgi:predicted type IV restriction endonuclease